MIKKMDWFDINVDDERLSEKFKFLLDVPYTAERTILSSWIKKFLVKDGLKKTINEFQTTFHTVFWEIYLNELFLEENIAILPGAVSPDFHLKRGSSTFFVEAVVANIANGARTEEERTTEEIYGVNEYPEIMDESIVRISNAISYKLGVFKEKYKAQVTNNSFVVAVGDFGQVNYGQSYYLPMLALLYNAYYDPEDTQNLLILGEDTYGKEYKYLESFIKSNGSPLTLGLFSGRENSHVSAVIYSCMLTLGKLSSLCESHSPLEKYIRVTKENYYGTLDISRYSGSSPDETLGDGLFVFHNPFATNKLDSEILQGKGITHVFFDPESGEIEIDTKGGMTLMRRYVCMKADAPFLIPDFDEINWIPVRRSDAESS
ncbi:MULTISPECIES: hypothetical protein [Pseudomonas]|uniref:hypothetical protein n=1 Tax=Pseudomonas TaxID=286 RepID=UPI001AE17CA8|nr:MULTISPECIES: hypothetical protein [unclassified Pseudomonas]MBP1124402.1 hypothetical protein [Pseudomonas sp. PvP025]MDQ0398262.1 hypothetical protein [Pseudomonas sp. PvP006]